MMPDTRFPNGKECFLWAEFRARVAHLIRRSRKGQHSRFVSSLCKGRQTSL